MAWACTSLSLSVSTSDSPSVIAIASIIALAPIIECISVGGFGRRSDQGSKR